MNSLFGKMIQDKDRFSNVDFAFNDQDILRLVDDHDKLVLNFEALRSGDCARVRSKNIGPSKKKDMYLDTMAPVGVAILAWSRTYMAMYTNDLIVACPNVRLLYTDTDSIYVGFPTPACYERFQVEMGPRYIGKQLLMHFKAEVEESSVVSFCAVLPKCYSMQMRKPSSAELVDYHKIKGVSQRYNRSVLAFDEYMKQVFEPDADPLMGSAFNIAQRQPLQLYSQRTSKVLLTNRLTKRAWLPGNPIFTYPHGHIELDQEH